MFVLNAKRKNDDDNPYETILTQPTEQEFNNAIKQNIDYFDEIYEDFRAYEVSLKNKDEWNNISDKIKFIDGYFYYEDLVSYREDLERFPQDV
jgi:hypothetical protein